MRFGAYSRQKMTETNKQRIENINVTCDDTREISKTDVIFLLVKCLIFNVTWKWEIATFTSITRITEWISMFQLLTLRDQFANDFWIIVKRRTITLLDNVETTPGPLPFTIERLPSLFCPSENVSRGLSRFCSVTSHPLSYHRPIHRIISQPFVRRDSKAIVGHQTSRLPSEIRRKLSCQRPRPPSTVLSFYSFLFSFDFRVLFDRNQRRNNIRFSRKGKRISSHTGSYISSQLKNIML